MKAKLAYLCSSQTWGGLEMNHVRNALWMQERGNEVCLICVKGSRLDKYAWELGVPTHHIEPHKKYYDFRKAKVLADFLSTYGFTHLLIRSTSDMSIMATVKKILGESIHTSYFMEMQIGVKKTHLLHSIRYKYIDLWSCPLLWLQEQVKDLTNYKNELRVIPSGIDLNKFNDLPEKNTARKALDLPGDKLIFGLIGRFDPQKGQILLLEAMKKCKHEDFAVVFLGEPTLFEGDEYANEMNTFIDEHNLKGRVFIRPFMDTVGVFYRAVDWIVMATKAETFGMVTVESLACGTPVLGSNAGGTPEILSGMGKHGGVLFETMNSNSLAEKIDFIIDDKIQFESDHLIQMAQHYDHNMVCDLVEDALGIRSIDQ